MKDTNPHRNCLTVSVVGICFAGFVAIAYAIGRFQGELAASMRISSAYISALATAEEHEERILREQSSDDRQPPIRPGLFVYAVMGEDEASMSQVAISERNGYYYLRFDNDEHDVKISSDGRYFDWAGNGYGHDRHIGIIRDRKIVGRTYYWHGGEIGLEHFEIRPKAD